jgi:HSP20 family protein
LPSVPRPWNGEASGPTPVTFAAINVVTTGGNVTVFASGINPKQLDISLQQNVLSISGKREVSVDKNAAYYRQERFEGEFRWVLALPRTLVRKRCRPATATALSR